MNLNFIKKHGEAFTILGLFVAFYFLFFHNLWAYPLMDVDETRYVSMSRDMFHTKDFLTLYLNGDFFFEKPPLYFWLESLSFAVFHKISEFTARFPIALVATLTCFLIYFTGKKIVSRRYGVISALILATSIEFLMLAKIAILDMLLAACVAFSLYLGLMTYFCTEQNKKFFWWGFYIFSALAVMAKGIPGFVIPFGIMFLAGILSKKLKEYFRPQYFLIGMVLFFGISLPWHLIMLNMHDPLFFNEYVMKHHLSRFLGSKDLGREQPWFYFILTLLWGLIPWSASFISMATKGVRDFNYKKFLNFEFEKYSNREKFVILNIVAFGFILLFFSSSSTKLVTYILPIYASASFLLANYWEKYIFEGENKTPIAIGVYIFNSILILAAFAVAFSGFFLPTEIKADIAEIKWFAATLFFVLPLVGIIFAKRDNRMGVFASYVAFVIILSAFGAHKIFNVDYKFGQNDLIEYAKYAKENKNTLATFKFGRRYSLLYYYGGNVKFQQEEDYKWLKEFLKQPDSVVILRNKQLDEITQKADFIIIKKGRKYCLVKGKQD